MSLFCTNPVKKEFSWKNGLCQFLNISTIYHYAKKSEKTHDPFMRKCRTDRQTERQTDNGDLSDGSLLYEEDSTKWTKTPKNVQSRGKTNTFLGLVTTTVISRHSCKMSRECFKFFKTLSNIPKIDPKILHNGC